MFCWPVKIIRSIKTIATVWKFLIFSQVLGVERGSICSLLFTVTLLVYVFSRSSASTFRQISKKSSWNLFGGAVAQLVSGTVHWVTQSSPRFESRLEPPIENTLRCGRWSHCVTQKLRKIHKKKNSLKKYYYSFQIVCSQSGAGPGRTCCDIPSRQATTQAGKCKKNPASH